MEIIQGVFNNREIAIGFWSIIAITGVLFTKTMQEFLKTCIHILFCRKFILFYLVFLGSFSLTVYLLFTLDFWDISLLKETLFWIIFVELPIFAKTIKNAKDSRFFVNLIKKNLQFIVIINFLLRFWTFSLLTELIIVPVSVFCGVMFAKSSIEKKYEKVKPFLKGIYFIYGVVVLENAISSTLNNPNNLLAVRSLKSLLLPISLLLLNIPVIYGLALHSTYEQVFIRLKGTPSEQRKMKLTLILFAGIVLSKITYVYNNIMRITFISSTNIELIKNLKKIEQKLTYQVGENYMKRANLYFRGSILGLLISLVGIVVCNSQAQLKDILSMNFVLDVQRMKEIATYIFSFGVVVSIVLFFISWGLKSKKYEEISNVKKYLLYDLLYLIKKQNSVFQEYIPIDSPKELYIQYIWFAYELKTICEKDLGKYENILTKWELDTLKELQTCLYSVVVSVKISSDDFYNYSIDDFCSFFKMSTENAPQNEKINIYTDDVEKSLEKYEEQIQLSMNEFKNIMP